MSSVFHATNFWEFMGHVAAEGKSEQGIDIQPEKPSNMSGEFDPANAHGGFVHSCSSGAGKRGRCWLPLTPRPSLPPSGIGAL